MNIVKTKINLIVVLMAMIFSSAIYAQDSTARLAELKQELEVLNTLIRPKSKRIKEIDLDWIDRGRPSGELADNQERKKLLVEIGPLSDRKKLIEYEIYTIELAEILQSERTRNIYDQVLEAETHRDARKIILNYTDSLLNEARESRILTHDGEVMKSIQRIGRILDLGTLKYERDNRNDRIYYRGNRRAPKGGDSEN